MNDLEVFEFCKFHILSLIGQSFSKVTFWARAPALIFGVTTVKISVDFHKAILITDLDAQALAKHKSNFDFGQATQTNICHT